MGPNLWGNNINSNNSLNIFIEKSVKSKTNYINIGSMLTYIVEFKNESNYDLDNVFIIEDLIEGLKYEYKTLRINGMIPLSGDIDLNKGALIPIGNVRKNSRIIISFDVLIEDILKQYPISNYVRVIYKYQKNNITISEIKTSNNVLTYLDSPQNNGGFVMDVEKSNMTSKGSLEEIQFRIFLKPFNSIQKAYLSKYLNDNFDFVSAKVIYENSFENNFDKKEKYIPIGNVRANERVLIIINGRMKEKINSSDLYFTNEAVIQFSDNNLNLSSTTNKVYVYKEDARIEYSVSGLKNQLNKGDITEVLVKLNHVGSGYIENYSIQNVIPKNLEYIDGSAFISYNNLINCKLDFDKEKNDITIPFIANGDKITIGFKVKSLGSVSKPNNITVSIDMSGMEGMGAIKMPEPIIQPSKKEYNINHYEQQKSCDSADLLSTLEKKSLSDCGCGCSTIDYVVTFTNKGDLAACNILANDILSGGTFDLKSVVVSTDKPIGPKPHRGNLPKILIERVEPKETIIITFSVNIDKNSPSKEVKNYLELCYQYYTCLGECVNVQGKSNTVVTEINEGNIESSLLIDESTSYQTEVNQEVVYKIAVENKSDLSLYDVSYDMNFNQDITNYIRYKPNSLIINGGTSPSTDVNPNDTPIKIGTIKPFEIVYIEFREITLEPTNKPILSYAKGIYSYQTNPNFPLVTCQNDTNDASLVIIPSMVNMKKQAFNYCAPSDTSCVVKPIVSAGVGDRITYEVTISNTSSITLESTLFNDTLPSNITYVDGSLKINGVSVPFDLQPNLQIGDINPGSTTTISFDAIINSLPENSNITNTACINYEYIVNQSTCERSSSKTCASNSISISYADLISTTPTKVSDNKVVSRTDPAKSFGNYTVAMKNSGNIEALNVKVVDKLPQGLTFVANSVVVTGVDKFGNIVPLKVDSIPLGESLNIENGIIIEKIPPQVTVTIKYGYTVNSDAPNSIDNTANFDYSYISDGVLVTKPDNITTIDTILVVDNILDVRKTAIPTIICPGETLLYTINIKNQSSTKLDNIILQDTIPTGTDLVPYSFTVDFKPFTINGVPVTGNSLASGVDIGSISIASTKIAQFQVKLNSSGLTSPLVNKVNVKYTNKTIASKLYSSVALASIPDNCPQPPPSGLVALSKDAYNYCNQSSVSCVVSTISKASIGDRITYKIPVQNVSDLVIDNVILKDNLPGEVSYVANSLKVDGTTVSVGDLSNLPLGNINPNQGKIVTFDVVVNSIPSLSNLTNTACVNFDYNKGCQGCTTISDSKCTSNTLKISSPDLKTGFKKYVNSVGTVENYKNPGEEVPYILEVQNLGNEDAINVVLIDTIPSQVGYLEGTVTVTPTIPTSNITEPTHDSEVLLIKFDTIPSGGKYEVYFDTILGYQEAFGSIYNKGQINYSYISNSSGNIESLSVLSNTVVSHVNSASIVVTKNVSASEVDINVPVTYTITATNVGNVVANNVFVSDVLPTFVNYVPNSLKINGVSSTANINAGILLGSIQPSKTDTISFQVVATTAPELNPIMNMAFVSFTYVSDPTTQKEISTGTQSNSVYLTITAADLITEAAIKQSDKFIVSKTDPANNSGTYSTILYNSGNTHALNVNVVDTIPNGMVFTPNSVTVVGTDGNGNNVPLVVDSVPPGGPLNIENGIIIEEIPPYVKATVSFGYTTTSYAPDLIDNTANFGYSYIVTNTVVNKQNNPTTTVTIVAVKNTLEVDNTVVPGTVCPGQTLSYNIDIKNVGNEVLNNIILQDTIPSGTTLVPSSFTLNFKPFTINGVPVTSNDLAKGIDIGSITIGNSAVAQFLVKVNSGTTISPIVNTANVDYVNGTIPSQIFSSTTVATIPDNCPPSPPQRLLDLSKTAFNYCPPTSSSCTVNTISKASIGDRITYQIPVKNISNLVLYNAILNDNLPSEVSYVTNTLKINGETVSQGNVSNLPLGNINPNQTELVSFDVVVNSIPNTSTLSNRACVSFNYNQGCTGCTTISDTQCTSNNLSIVSSDLVTNFKKSVDSVGIVENYKQPGQEISYILDLQNTGNDSALNVVLIDTIPSQVGYIYGSVTVTPTIPASNITEPTSTNNELVINFTTIPSNASYEVKFNTVLNSTISYGDIYDVAGLNYSYISASTGNKESISILSNTVVSHVNSASIVVTKGASASEVDINVPVTYTINVQNKGNVVANNVFISDVIPTFVNYVPNSLKVNGLPSSADINSGILLGSIKPSQTDTISFQVVATTAPKFNPIVNMAFASFTYVSDPKTQKEISSSAQSNQVYLLVKAADLISETPIKQSDKFIVSSTDPANNSGTYSVILYNSGNTDALNVVVIDTIPNGLLFTPNSVVVIGTDSNGNNVPLVVNSVPPGGPLNIENGIVIEDIPPYVKVTISYGYTTTLNAPNSIDNTANFNYSYVVSNTIVNSTNNQTTTSTIKVVPNTLEVDNTVVPGVVCPGQTLAYTVDIKNLGNDVINNVVLQDTIPAGTTLVPSSFTLNFEQFTINGNPVTNDNLAQGINIGSITIGNSAVAQFLVRVNTTTTITPIVNTANVDYVNGSIQSQVFSSTALATIPAGCPIIPCQPCPPCPPCPPPHPCNQCCNNCYNKECNEYCNQNCNQNCNECNHQNCNKYYGKYYNKNNENRCPYYNKPSCKPGKRSMCRQISCSVYNDYLNNR
ncbi:MAG: hypothetical protein RSD22_06515 [Romboutsia sp.]